MKHQKCDRVIAQMGYNPGRVLCQCIEKQPTIHLENGCSTGQRPGSRTTFAKLTVTCKNCIKYHVEKKS